jgi:histidinol-phosphate aminotransferase
MPTLPLHGGTDDGPWVTHDFSTNANPLGPPPALWRAVQQADRQRYPDPHYRALRDRLAAAHAVPPEQILPTAGGAEAIRRLTLAALLQGLREVWVPQPGFGDYAAAAEALGLSVHRYTDWPELLHGRPALIWLCQPCNPSGTRLDSAALARIAAAALSPALLVIDLAYEPLRLDGEAVTLPPSCWQLHCPNKALGLTGVRAAYLVAPAPNDTWARLLTLAASWVLSAEGQTLLMHWHDAATLDWLAESRAQLRVWSAQQRALLEGLGWRQLGSCTPFWLAQPPPQSIEGLRGHGIKLRDAASFGLPGWVRIATLTPPAQQALLKALMTLTAQTALTQGLSK